MEQEPRFSGIRATEGCVLSFAISALGMLAISLVFSEWLGLVSADTEKIIGLVVWLLAIFAGGYFAARRGRTTGWTNAILVGVFAEICVAAMALSGTSLVEMMDDPGANWRRFVALGLTIPAAVLGGMLWDRTRNIIDNKDDGTDASNQPGS